MSTWGIKSAWGYEAVEIVKETTKCVFYKDARRGRSQETRIDKSKVLEWRGTEEQARSICAKLTSAAAEYNRRANAAAAWFKERKAQILRDSGSGPEGENSRSEVEGEAPQSGLSESEGIAQTTPGIARKEGP